ncbi:MAG: hypothetical protein K0S76_2064 [Herbinix sp.]|jgi:hypothetical protein|nr:hypothetical protein [Herbinix sp.]
MSRRVRVKPGKGQSMAGFFGGILFCGIGLFLAIPIFGPFGIIWTLFAVIITIMNGINAFSDKGVASHEILIEDEYRQDTFVSDKSVEERLKELQSLYDKGIITTEEFQEKRKQILEDI